MRSRCLPCFTALLLALQTVTLLEAVATASNNSEKSIRLVANSPAVAFYTAEGRRLFGYYDNPKPDSPAFVCAFRASRSRWSGLRRSLNYSLSVLYPSNASSLVASIRGRVIRLSGSVDTESRIVLACSVSYYYSGRNLSITEWNTLVIDPLAKLSGPRAWLDANYAESAMQRSIQLTSTKQAPMKSEENSIVCQVAVSPSAPQLAHLTLIRNGAALSLMPDNFEFEWNDSGDQLIIRARFGYRPAAENASDWFECRAKDPLTLEIANAPLKVSYKAGLSSVHIVNAITGQIVTNDSNIQNTDALKCQADVDTPEVKYSWRMVRTNHLVANEGPILNLTKVNLYYPICCQGENSLNGKIFRQEICASFRGNSTMHTVVLFDKDGRREASLMCGPRSTMGILQVRYSKLKCSEQLENLTSQMTSSEAVVAAVSNSENCSAHICVSPTVLTRVRRNCKRVDEGCRLDSIWLMDPLFLSTFRSQDAMKDECFAFSGGMVRIEIDYFCTVPSSVKFAATGRGASGEIVKYFAPRTGCFEISATGAAGGNHTTDYGSSGPGSWVGGRGASVRGKFRLRRGQMLAIVVGQHGGNSSEISPSRRPSIEDNAGAGGGGGSFVYDPRSLTLYIAAGGGGGASYTLDGVDGQAGTNGTDSSGPNASQRGRGGFNGSAGWTNTEAASYHGGCGAGWLSTGARRAGPEHGGAGHGGPLSRSPFPFRGGSPGGMNPGAVGGFGGGGGGSEDNGASGGGGGYSGGGAGTHDKQAGGGGGSFCNATMAVQNSCSSVTGGNKESIDGSVTVYYLDNQC